MVGDDDLRRLADWLRSLSRPVALTGAGVSTDSGIPDFRSPGTGLWAQVDPMRVASHEGFLDDPMAFYAFWGDRFGGLIHARPNVTHEVLALLERRGLLAAVVTQNIDNLHREAGSRRVLEVHGNFRVARCLGCGAREPTADVIARVRAGRRPQCPRCGHLIKPDVVLFGEDLPPVFDEGRELIAESELLLVLGCSLEVFPVADLVPMAKEQGARVVLINRDATDFDDLADLVLRGSLGDVMPRLRAEIERPR